MKIVRIALWVLVGVAIVGVGGLYLSKGRDTPLIASVTEIGGPFRLVDTQGRAVSRDDLLGRPHAIFFGYTHCPDVCPTTLWEMTQHLRELGEDGDKLRVVFVTVDPERDTQQVMQQYLSAFDKRILGLTGSREAVDEAVKAYRAFYKVHPPDEDGDVLVDHTADVYLFDAKGNLRSTISYGEDPEAARAKIRRLI